MVFGVFDGLHDGHREFLKQAKTNGEYLIAVLAQDHIVEHIKGRFPKIDLEQRFEHLREEDSVDMIVIGDHELNTWEVIEEHKPDIIVLGKDQEWLKRELESDLLKLKHKPELKVLDDFEPNIFHNSLTFL